MLGEFGKHIVGAPCGTSAVTTGQAEPPSFASKRPIGRVDPCECGIAIDLHQGMSGALIGADVLDRDDLGASSSCFKRLEVHLVQSDRPDGPGKGVPVEQVDAVLGQQPECTAEEAYCWTDGRAIFASGSPFDPVTCGSQTFFPAQGNNAYIFPGVGLGVVVSGARHVTDEMFGAAAHALAEQVTDDDMAAGRIYPVLSRIRDVSAAIAAKVAEIAWREGLATQPRPDDPERAIRAYMYDPQYTPLV